MEGNKYILHDWTVICKAAGRVCVPFWETLGERKKKSNQIQTVGVKQTPKHSFSHTPPNPRIY